MSSETKVILKYRRPADCWICPDCEAENNMLLASCAVCGLRKEPSVAVIPAWNGEEERAPIPVHRPIAAPVPGKHTPTPAPRPPMTARTAASPAKPPLSSPPPVRYYEEDSGSSTTIVLIILLIVVVGAIIIFALSSEGLAASEHEASVSNYAKMIAQGLFTKNLTV